jgi:hypothetical protein
MPAAHTAHTVDIVAPKAVEYAPATHGAHVTALPLGPKRPALQFAHAAAAEPEYWPVGQALQAAAMTAPVPAKCVPAGHETQLVVPALAAKKPAAHDTHEEARAAAYMPAPHSIHAAEVTEPRATEYVPAAHTRQTLDDPAPSMIE